MYRGCTKRHSIKPAGGILITDAVDELLLLFSTCGMKLFRSVVM